MPGEDTREIPSEVVQIEITEPTGYDLMVWNQIKDNGDLAYFMQEGALRPVDEQSRKTLLTRIEDILAINPNGILASQLKQGLEKFRVSEEKRKVFLEKHQRTPETRN